MRGSTTSLACIALSLSLAACGGGGGDGGGDDDPADPDAAPDPIDGAPGPDGPPGAWDCIGDPHPTTAGATLAVSGVAEAIDQNGTNPLAGVTITAHAADDDAMLDTATSAETTGAYAVSLTTGGAPLDGYLRGQIDSYKTTYVYPPAAIATDLDNIPVLMVSNLTWAFLPALAQATQDAENGFVGVLVVDCTGTPVAGATVTVGDVSADNIRYVNGTDVSPANTSTDATGIALVFDVPPGTAVMVDASAGGMDFEAHPIEVRADAITTTVVAPGPITGLAP